MKEETGDRRNERYAREARKHSSEKKGERGATSRLNKKKLGREKKTLQLRLCEERAESTERNKGRKEKKRDGETKGGDERTCMETKTKLDLLRREAVKGTY